MVSKAEELRTELSAYRQRVPRGCYPEELRQRAAAHVRERRRKGAGLGAIAKELAVTEATVKSWAGQVTVGDQLGHCADVSLIPVVVRAAERRTSPSVRQLEVQFPGGAVLRASEVSARALAQAVEVLRRSA
jgi:transposase-like protein